MKHRGGFPIDYCVGAKGGARLLPAKPGMLSLLMGETILVSAW